MSETARPVPGSMPRVRDQARQAVALMTFSAAASASFAMALLLLARLGG